MLKTNKVIYVRNKKNPKRHENHVGFKYICYLMKLRADYLNRKMKILFLEIFQYDGLFLHYVKKDIIKTAMQYYFRCFCNCFHILLCNQVCIGQFGSCVFLLHL